MAVSFVSRTAQLQIPAGHPWPGSQGRSEPIRNASLLIRHDPPKKFNGIMELQQKIILCRFSESRIHFSRMFEITPTIRIE